MNTPGENWKESSVSRRDVVRYIRMKDRLLAMLPWYQVPIEVYMITEVQNGDYIKLSMGPMGTQWCKRSQLEVLAILPQPKLNPSKGLLQQAPDCPPWLDCFDK